jgi:hypothetical protein
MPPGAVGKLRSQRQIASKNSEQKHKTPENATGNARERRAEGRRTASRTFSPPQPRELEAEEAG